MDVAMELRSIRLKEYLERRGLSSDRILDAIDLREGEVAFATGSIVDGVGDTDSDLDLYVLTSNEGINRRSHSFVEERQGQQTLHGFGITYIEIGSECLDVEFHSIDRYRALFVEISRIDPADPSFLWRNFRTLGPFDRIEALELGHRFRISVPMRQSSVYNALRQDFDEGKFMAWNALFHLEQAADLIKGVKRSLREGDPENAKLKLHRLYDNIVDARLFLSGVSMDRWKWRLPKLRTLGDTDLLNAFLDVQLGTGGEGSLAEQVSSQLALAVTLREKLFTSLSTLNSQS